MVVLPYNNRQWRNFFAAAGRDDMLDDPRTNDPVLRARMNAEMYAMISEIMTEKTTAEWEVILAEADVPAERVNRLEDLADDEHFRATGFFHTYDHPSEGRLRTPSPPLQFSASPCQAVRRPPPGLGEQTREVLAEAGLANDEIEELLAIKAAIAGS